MLPKGDLLATVFAAPAAPKDSVGSGTEGVRLGIEAGVEGAAAPKVKAGGPSDSPPLEVVLVVAVAVRGTGKVPPKGDGLGNAAPPAPPPWEAGEWTW